MKSIRRELLTKENVICMRTSVGRTKQAFALLSDKVLDNLQTFLAGDGVQ